MVFLHICLNIIQSDTMSKDEEPSCYWIIAKKIEDSKWRKFHSSGFYELTSDFQYWEFSPSNPNDFVQKKAYGRIEMRNKIEWMYHYYVLFMSGELQFKFRPGYVSVLLYLKQVPKGYQARM